MPIDELMQRFGTPGVSVAANYGFQGFLRGHLRHGYGVVVLTNGVDGSTVAQEIASRVARAYDWDSTHQPLRR